MKHCGRMGTLLIVVLSMALSSCGGGGGDSASVPSEIAVSTWIGAVGTQVSFPATATGSSFYRSTDANCDLDNYSTCTRGQLDIVNGSAVTDSAATLSRPAWYWLRQGTHTSLASAINTTRFSARYGHQAVAFNGKLWVVGGNDGDTYLNDVWSSSDGLVWHKVTSNAAFSHRKGHQLVVYDQRLWLVAGNDNGYKNDVWSSSDGADWRLGYNATIHFQ